MRERGLSFKEALNQAVCLGLGAALCESPRRRFRQKTYHMGFRPSFDGTKPSPSLTPWKTKGWRVNYNSANEDSGRESSAVRGQHRRSPTPSSPHLAGGDSVRKRNAGFRLGGVVLAFVRLSTRPGVFPQPLAAGMALDVIDTWLRQPCSTIVHPGEHHLRVAGPARAFGYRRQPGVGCSPCCSGRRERRRALLVRFGLLSFSWAAMAQSVAGGGVKPRPCALLSLPLQ